MTASVTEREIRSGVNGHRLSVDSPAVSTPARASVAVTPCDGKIGAGRVVSRVALARMTVVRGARRWWAWTGRPMSLAALWRTSAVDEQRIPLRSDGLTWFWRISNGTDRLFMFALVLVAPTFLTGPLRWLAARPTRRLGFYVLVAIGATVFTLIGHPAGKE